MMRVKAGGQWTLFSPNDTPDLHDLYGKAFEQRYEEYERLADQGKVTLFKRVEAVALWRKMLTMLFETGHPWITFKDPSNIRSPQGHVGVVHSSNLCTEILLNSSAEETAVCNLGSVNLAVHVSPNGIDRDLLARTIRTAMRMLDNVIDINFYPTPEARNANLKHRPVGLGLMGFQDALYRLRLPYASEAAVAFADASMEIIAYHALLASVELAKERGPYASFEGSKWSAGLLPIDTVELLARERGGFLEMDRSERLDWSDVRNAIRVHGLRNSNTMAIAPTATISNIVGVGQSIEPTYKHLFAKANLSGDFTTPNTFLVADLKERGLWDAAMLDDLKYYDGSIQDIERVPADLKELYRTAFEIESRWLIECASRRQKWLDMGQSLNLYLAQPNGKQLSEMYLLAWEMGLKTTYYLRSLAATQIEKSTTDVNRRGLQPRWMKNKSASANVQLQRENEVNGELSGTEVKLCLLNDPTCEACQ
jgi:ribonucleoside-diphosphate reductase alpha chain